jgi:hypothetical protein
VGFLDKLGYNIAPFFGPIGRGIAESLQGGRFVDNAAAINNAPDLASFANIQQPDNIYSPEHYLALEKLKAAKLAELQQQGAAPIAKMLARFAAEGNDADPNFNGAEWVKGMATTDAGMSPEEYDALTTGAVPGVRKSSLPASAFGANPVTADLLQKAELAAQQKGTMARAFDNGVNAKPMDLATLAMNKELATGFDTTAKGTAALTSERNANDKIAQSKAALDAYLTTPAVQTPESMTNFRTTVMKAGGTPEASAALLKSFDEKNDPYKNLDEAALTLKSLRGDKEAQQVLDKMQGRKVQTARESRPPKSTVGSDYDRRQTDNEFQSDISHLRNLDKTIAVGGKGIVMMNGVPTSFDGTAESLAELKQARSDHESMMRSVYKGKRLDRLPKRAVPPAPAASGKKASDFWKTK